MALEAAFKVLERLSCGLLGFTKVLVILQWLFSGCIGLSGLRIRASGCCVYGRCQNFFGGGRWGWGGGGDSSSRQGYRVLW